MGDPDFAFKVRKRLGLTMNEMGLLLQASRAAVFRWEQAKRLPRPRTLLRYSRIIEKMEASRDS